MSELSPRVALPYLMPSQAQKHVTHIEALQRLDMLTQLSLKSFASDTPPALPAAGDMYGVGAAPTGAWAGQAGRLAYWDGTVWLFITPAAGWRAWGEAEQELRVWRNTAWQSSVSSLNNLSLLGVGTTADAINPLSVAADGSLFTHAGSGHRLTLNKADAGSTVSTLFQTNWTGHAEIGLAGDNDLSIKVSPDGTTWNTALQISPDTGLLSGAGVQSMWTDTSEGKLVTTKGARAAVSSGHGGYYNPTAGIDIDTVAAGFVGLVYDSNAGTWPTPAYGAFVWIDTQAIYAGSAVLQRAIYGYASTGTPIPAKSYRRMRSNDGTGWSAWEREQPEYGSNVNGWYVRYPDGTQICADMEFFISRHPASEACTETRRLWAHGPFQPPL